MIWSRQGIIHGGGMVRSKDASEDLHLQGYNIVIPYPFVPLHLQFYITLNIVIVICNMQLRNLFKSL